MLSSRIIRYGIYAGTGGLVLVGSAKIYDPKIDISPVGVIRFGRAALTVNCSDKKIQDAFSLK